MYRLRRSVRGFATAQGGAVAPVVAISLVGLIAAGGLAFDFARFAALDTELQNAADHAALAAATQLDRTTGACARAARAAASLISNQTLFANDGNASGIAITVATETGCDAVGSVRFYQDKAKTQAANDHTNARFVEVDVDARRVDYALTPLVGALRSGQLIATAFAGMGTAICKVPPVMICNPDEPLTNTDTGYQFNVNTRIGHGIKLITGNADTPGNFGFLDTEFGNGASDLAGALGWNTPPGECSPIDGVDLKTGLNAVVMNAVNTRFDVYANGANTCPSGGACSPARNVRKDLVRGNNCGTNGQQAWQESENPYRPTSATALPATTTPDVMGHPRDMCHAWSNDGNCGGVAGRRMGDGNWDRDAYFRSNYGWTNAQWTAAMTAAGYTPATLTRYQVYTWEMERAGLGGNGTPGDGSDGTPGDIDTPKAAGSKTAYAHPSCGIPGITPGGTSVDRRRISAAVLNCKAHGLHGSEDDVPVLKWVEIFLVEPSFRRRQGSNTITEMHDVYVELIGETGSGQAGQTAGQVIRRDVPYLIE